MTITFVGPRQTEYASTQGTIAATSTTQLNVSKKARNQKPIAVVPKSLEKFSSVFQPARWKSRASTANPRPAGHSQRQPRRGDANQTSAKHAGIRTSETKAMSDQVDAFHRLSWNAK